MLYRLEHVLEHVLVLPGTDNVQVPIIHSLP
jgi:hypothetical protein